MDMDGIFIGTAGWSVPKIHAAHFPATGSHLSRYAARFNAVEINTSFYRPHQRKTYERWAATVGSGFRFAVKAPKAITHEARLSDCGALIDRFHEEASGLGEKLGAVLIQLPPSLGFDPAVAEAFFMRMAIFSCPLVLEARHPGWFTPEAMACLGAHKIASVAADPSPVARGREPGGWPVCVYYRLHGAPHIYHSPYTEDALRGVAEDIRRAAAAGKTVWCIFDNTASFAAAEDARILCRMLDHKEA